MLLLLLLHAYRHATSAADSIDGLAFLAARFRLFRLADGDRLLIGSTTGGLWVSENGGDAWKNILTTLPPIYAIKFI